jgi:hypothetical protein
MKKIGIGLVTALVVTSFLYLVIEVLVKPKIEPDWNNIESKTVGTVCQIDLGRGGGAWFCYDIDGKSYKDFDGLSISGLTLGEKYWIKYSLNSSNELTNKIKSIDYLPIFEDGEKVDTSRGKITRKFKFKWWGKGADSGIEFIYYYKGKEYERTQYLPPNYQSLFPNIAEGQEYPVKAWIDNPQRAVIIIDANQ